MTADIFGKVTIFSAGEQLVHKYFCNFAPKQQRNNMTKEEICGNWLQRYTKVQLEEFGDLILLTNFNNYVDMFCEQMNVTAVGFDANMRAATAEGITMINFGMGSPKAALNMD